MCSVKRTISGVIAPTAWEGFWKQSLRHKVVALIHYGVRVRLLPTRQKERSESQKGRSDFSCK